MNLAALLEADRTDKIARPAAASGKHVVQTVPESYVRTRLPWAMGLPLGSVCDQVTASSCSLKTVLNISNASSGAGTRRCSSFP